MNTKIVLGIVALVVLVVAVIGFVNIFGSPSTIGDVVKTTNTENVKEFVMESFYDENGIWFSLKEINSEIPLIYFLRLSWPHFRHLLFPFLLLHSNFDKKCLDI